MLKWNAKCSNEMSVTITKQRSSPEYHCQWWMFWAIKQQQKWDKLNIWFKQTTALDLVSCASNARIVHMWARAHPFHVHMHLSIEPKVDGIAENVAIVNVYFFSAFILWNWFVYMTNPEENIRIVWIFDSLVFLLFFSLYLMIVSAFYSAIFVSLLVGFFLRS